MRSPGEPQAFSLTSVVAPVRMVRKSAAEVGRDESPDEGSPMRRWLTFLAVACACTASLPTRALAWGRQGHEITGRIADKYLDERARAAIGELLKGH
jgi:hypothetical protein